MNELTQCPSAQYQDRGKQEIPFAETLPKGNPMLALKGAESTEDFNSLIKRISVANPTLFLELLAQFSPQDRVKFLALIDWHEFTERVSEFSDREATYLSFAARESLGDDNTRALALNLTKRIELEPQMAGIKLATGLPLESVPSIFAQYGNIGRRNIDWLDGGETWKNILYSGIHTLYICVSMNREKGVIPPEEATQIINLVIEDLSPIIERVIGSKTTLDRGEFMIRKIRECMTNPSAMDKMMAGFGFQWVEEGGHKQGNGGGETGKYRKVQK